MNKQLKKEVRKIFNDECKAVIEKLNSMDENEITKDAKGAVIFFGGDKKGVHGTVMGRGKDLENMIANVLHQNKQLRNMFINVIGSPLRG